MVSKVRVPKVSANIDEVTLTAWLKAEGDTVAAGEPLVEVTTDKTCVEVESPAGGVVRSILAVEKSMIPVGYVVALIGEPDDPLPDVEQENAELTARFQSTPQPARTGRRAKAGGKRVRVRATPRAKRLARELNVDIAAVKAAMALDRVTEQDVLTYKEQTDA